MNRGIFKIDGHKLTPYLLDAQLQHSQIQFILPIAGNSKLIGTANNGVLNSTAMD
jgi:hypothetical protein